MEVITIGETMVLFNTDSPGPLRYAHNFNMSIAGAESNVAIALARLEHNAGWMSRIGNDEFGRYIKSVIRGEGVDVSKVSIDETHQTGLLFKEQFAHANPNIYYYRKHSAASMLGVCDIDEDYIASAKILHITGITLALSQSARESVYKAIDIAKRRGVLVSFDPNIRLKLWSIEEAKPVLLDVAKKADIIFPGIDEGKLLLGLEDHKDITKAFLDMGCKVVATKVGKKGCFVSDGKKESFVEGYVVEKTVDSVGAGDGFAAGFLSGYLRNKDLYDCAKLGNAIGAMATLVKGDIEGYPTLSQVNEFMGISSYIDR